MGRSGGIALGSLLKDLEDRLINYFAMLNEIRAGLKPEVRYEKPKELELYEQMKEFKIPLATGGILEQPHIWVLQYKICQRIADLFEAQQEKAK